MKNNRKPSIEKIKKTEHANLSPPSRQAARRSIAPISRRSFLGRTSLGGAASVVTLAASTNAWTQSTTQSTAQSSGAAAEASGPSVTTLHVQSSRAVNRFEPNRSLGSSMDDLTPQLIREVYTPEDVKLCLSTGWGPITYRNHTELSRQAWHWNPNGAWSDAAHQRGYFVGSAELGAPITDSFPYDLEHRGASGGDSRGYSRLTDGNPRTFWKSNPYLSRHFTGKDDALLPQWVIVDLRRAQAVDTVRIAWAEPRATVYEIQYWNGPGDPLKWEDVDLSQFRDSGPLPRMSRAPKGVWTRFPNGSVKNGGAGAVSHRVGASPVRARFIRILMSQSSGLPSPDAADGDHDIRHRSGYAIHEIWIGRTLADGSFADLTDHSPDANQTPTHVSSTDCYSTAQSQGKTGGDQTGMDLFFTSGITNNLPAMIPVAVLYSTPEDAANQILYLKRRKYPIAWVEMGEECDGKHCMPEDYAELYIQFADAIHKLAPETRIGGPALQGINLDIWVWPDAQGRTSWTERFVDYLKAHNHLQDLTFFSFEQYPFDPRRICWADLLLQPEINHSLIDALRYAGVPERVPLMVDESSIAANVTEVMSGMFSGLWLADTVGSFLRYGGAAYYHSPIQPQPNFRGARGYATWSNFFCNRNLKVTGYTAFYYVGELINKEWVTHGAGACELYAVDGGLVDDAGRNWITAYAVKRPDGEWSLMIINKDRDRAHPVRIAFSARGNRLAQSPEGARAGYFSGSVHMATFGSEQYVFHGTSPDSVANPDLPPVHSTIQADRETTVSLPKCSVTILRGRVEGL